MTDCAATFCACLVDEWVRCGVRSAVICPGSRSTPMALALGRAEASGLIGTHVHLDERSAGFVALGVAMMTKQPCIVLTTSGTATVELHAAVAEAHHASVPLIVCTADRPPELQGVGAAQTIDQVRLYGNSLRWYGDLGVPDMALFLSWRSFGSRAYLEATGRRPGPVQVNLPFREPLIGEPAPLPTARRNGTPWHRRLATVSHLAPENAEALLGQLSGRRGIIVAGAGTHAAPDGPAAVLELADALGWPVLAEPRSGCRVPHSCVVGHADAFLRNQLVAEALRVDVIVQVGALPASKVLGQWLTASGAERIVLDATGSWPDPDRVAQVVIDIDAAAFSRALLAAMTASDGNSHTAPQGWLQAWRGADDAAAEALVAALGQTQEATEPAVARGVMGSAADGDVVVVSSSMPVRDVEWFSARRHGVRVFANRGANGIDGVLSTAVGVATADTATANAVTWLLIGDLALLHDSSALTGLAARKLPLRIVVIDNGGGGIFSFLGQATALDPPLFERYWGTPQPVAVAELAAVHGLSVRTAHTATDLRDGLDWLAGYHEATPLLVVQTDRAANVAFHEVLNTAMGSAAAEALNQLRLREE